jgi:hypothetical protein
MTLTQARAALDAAGEDARTAESADATNDVMRGMVAEVRGHVEQARVRLAHAERAREAASAAAMAAGKFLAAARYQAAAAVADPAAYRAAIREDLARLVQLEAEAAAAWARMDRAAARHEAPLPVLRVGVGFVLPQRGPLQQGSCRVALGLERAYDAGTPPRCSLGAVLPRGMSRAGGMPGGAEVHPHRREVHPEGAGGRHLQLAQHRQATPQNAFPWRQRGSQGVSVLLAGAALAGSPPRRRPRTCAGASCGINSATRTPVRSTCHVVSSM